MSAGQQGDAAVTSTGQGRPRIAYLTGEFPRVTDTWIQRELTGLTAAGFAVKTFSIRRPDGAQLVGEEQREAYASTTYLLDAARSFALPVAHLRALASSPRRYLDTLALAWSTRRRGVKGTFYQLVYFAEAGLLSAKLQAEAIDHLHNHFGDSSCSVAMLASRLASVPFSFTLHGPGIFFDANTWRIDEKLRQATFCSTISHYARSQAGVFADAETLDKVHIVHCGVEPERLRPVRHEGRGTRLLFVGRIVEFKGLGVLFSALAAMRKHHADLHLTIVGDGPDRKRLEKRASALGIASMVTFVGARSQAEVADHFAATDIFVLPSFAEGLPVVLMEALGAGVAAVTTRIAGVPELIEHDETGLLVSPADTGELVEALGRLIDDPQLRQRLGNAGRSRVLSDFSSRTEAERLGRLFVNYSSCPTGLRAAVRPKPLPRGASPNGDPAAGAPS